MFRSRFLPLFAAILLLAFCVSNVKADSSTTIYRNGNASVSLGDGESWTVTYNPDGYYPTLYVWEPLNWWAFCLAQGIATPVTVLEVYIWSARYGWQFINRFQVGPLGSAKLVLYGAKGTQYRFFIKNYQQVTPVYMQVR